MNDLAVRLRGTTVSFTWAGALRGARAMLPIVPGAVAFGLVYGFVAGEKGLSVLEIALTSLLVFAGASQFLALELWHHPLPVAGLVMGVLVVNLRHLLMGPALLPWLADLRPAQAYASLYVMTDESWGASVAELRRGGRDAAFLLGAGLTLYGFWVASTVLGRAAGDLSGMIERWGLDYLTTAFFVALLAGFWRSRNDALPWAVAGGVAVAAKAFLPGTWYIVLGAVAGSLLGAWRDVR
ncbi:AzlC family ABC transporter permease [Benzoatithermus flavus]|uniref:AzlC family ABC transporter permease n=1 Tax=Benzoatithermus flavus TaxID=3108223 RepID=A0ABU8XYV4_9PROT